MSAEQSAYKPVCDNCPTIASLEEAEAMTQANEAFYKNPTSRVQAVGYIALLKEIHFDLRQTIDCERPVRDTAKQLACPLEQSMKNTLYFMKGPGDESNYEYESFKTPDNTEPGQNL